MFLNDTKWDNRPRPIQGTARAETLAPWKSVPSLDSPRFHPYHLLIPPPVSSEVHTPTPSQRQEGREETTRAGQLLKLKPHFIHCNFYSSNNRKHGESSLPGTGFSPVAGTSKTGCSLATTPCAGSPAPSAGAGWGALRSLHPATELSFSMSCQPSRENPFFHAGRAHTAMLPTIF